jgi:hypothetical protein
MDRQSEYNFKMPLLDILLELVRLPYDAGKQFDEASLVGQSELDRKSRRFWKWVAWVLTAVIVFVPIALWILWRIYVN